MHLMMLLVALGLAWSVRYRWVESGGHWEKRWQWGLRRLLFPPLMLLSTAIAVMWMGPHGQMVWAWEGWLSYALAIGWLVFAGILWLKHFWEGWHILQTIRTHSTTNLRGSVVRVLEIPTLYCAQVGFWHPELVISQGILDTLGADHLEAVLAHEQAHHHYRDTFWFFWLGWIRQMTAWLPQTESIWQELLMLRELRADLWASRQTDALLLAEALLLVVNHPRPRSWPKIFLLPLVRSLPPIASPNASKHY
ncbi:M56 family metallopeptidase [Neosynechococcus sphagnicola]|uniref:M56 family metallopeptidase n=1 Tax=Neosynechococcus sphagnicola TaxID=1501145 RepID=UPI001EF9DD59|nr:M56 family metallopeptidase [Neosynechococcus sphagnicola]